MDGRAEASRPRSVGATVGGSSVRAGSNSCIRHAVVRCGLRADPPPRQGGALEVLVDGGEALPRIAEALAGARSHVHIAGWHVTPDFGLTRDDQASRLLGPVDSLLVDG